MTDIREIIDGLFDSAAVWESRASSWPHMPDEPEHQKDLNATRVRSILHRSPVLVPYRSYDTRIMRLLDASAMPLARKVFTYEGDEGRINCINDLHAKGRKVNIQIPLMKDHVPDEVYAVDRDVIIRHNHKSWLHKLVNPAHVPERRILRSTAAVAKAVEERDPQMPVVLKFSSDRPSMGGDDVFICQEPAEALQIYRRFGQGSHAILEEWIEARDNLCVQFVITEGEIHYIGKAEQIIEDGSHHVGNIIRHDPEGLPAQMEAVLSAACLRAQRAGYRGIAGFDVLVDHNGMFWVIDMNFRINGSSAALIHTRDYLYPGSGEISVQNRIVPIEDHNSITALEIACANGWIRVIGGCVSPDQRNLSLTIMHFEKREQLASPLENLRTSRALML